MLKCKVIRQAFEHVVLVTGHIGLHTLDVPVQQPLINHIEVKDLKWDAVKRDSGAESSDIHTEPIVPGQHIVVCCM